MRIKGFMDEDFVNYKLPSMYIGTAFCDFKCDRESGVSCCQNSSLAQMEFINVPDEIIIERYLSNPITKAICFAGLEPFEQFAELYCFIQKLREAYHCPDTVVIYTGFDKNEVLTQIDALRKFSNIIVKFGRFIPNADGYMNNVLGVRLASQNQYAEVIS